VRILLPANYQTAPATPYPVLYLLHGGGGGYADWSAGGSGDIKNVVAGTPFNGIVVMPEGGRAGWYSNWRGNTDGGFAPQWEDFHIRQLVPWIDANFNTLARREGRAVAGLSMGGLGALQYAGRFTSTFSRIGSFSAGTDLNEPGAQKIVADSMWQVGATIGNTGLLNGNYRVSGSTLQRMETVFGPTSGWATQNPYQMANAYNAYDTKFGLYSGQNTSSLEGERQIGQWNDRLHAQLGTNGVVHRYCTGTGSHSWGYWRADLRDFLFYAYGTTPASCPNGWGAPR
jgi:S-formylglutathione hydrolase FrmB